MEFISPIQLRVLISVFAEVVRGAPPGIRVEVHGTRAVRLEDAPDGGQRLTLASGRVLTGLAAVVLTQGHLPALPDRAERDLTEYATSRPPTRPTSTSPPSPPGNPSCCAVSASTSSTTWPC